MLYDIRSLFEGSIKNVIFEKENNRYSNNLSPTSEAHNLRHRKRNNVPRHNEDFILD